MLDSFADINPPAIFTIGLERHELDPQHPREKLREDKISTDILRAASSEKMAAPIGAVIDNGFANDISESVEPHCVILGRDDVTWMNTYWKPCWYLTRVF